MKEPLHIPQAKQDQTLKMDTPTTNPLASILPLSIWMTEDAATVFPTKRTWDLFCNTHKEELVKAGALFLGAARRPDYVDAEVMGGIVREILIRESIARLHELGEKA